MSWDVLLFNFGGNPPDFKELPKDLSSPSMGDAQEVRNAVKKSVSDVDWTDPAWGTIDGDGWSMDLNHQKEGDTTKLMLHVIGSGDPIPTIVELCKAYNWSAFDTTTGKFIDLANPSDAGWKEFQAFRDKVMDGFS